MLYVCPTPIGNLADITLRVLEVLRSVDLVACEDTRRTGKLLAHNGIEARMVSFFEHNELRRLEQILVELEAGVSVALVSDAGTPGLSDPGYTLVRAALDRGLPVTVLPGASAITTALVASGLPSDRFTFIGYLPRTAGRLIAFVEEAGTAGGTLVAFESPRRLRRTLVALAERWPNRELAVARELTKMHEELLRGSAGQLLELLDGREEVRGEIVLLLAPEEEFAAGGAQESEVRAALAAMLDRGMGVKEASRLVAALTQMSAREAYRLAVAVREKPARR